MSWEVFATPTLRKITNPLIHDELSHKTIKFNLTCESGGSVLVDESILKKSPVLASIVERQYLESTTQHIYIGIQECHQETLNLALEFMKGNLGNWKRINPSNMMNFLNGKLNLWKQIPDSNVHDLIILADYLQLDFLSMALEWVTWLRGNPNNWNQINVLNVEYLIILAERFESHKFLDDCIVWIIKEMHSSGFQLSDSWKQENPELSKEINTIFEMVDNVKDVHFDENAYLQGTLKGKDYFQKLEGIKRFSGLEVRITDSVMLAKQSFFDRVKKAMGMMKSKSIRVTSLRFYPSDQSALHFLDDNVSYPLLKELSLYNTNLSNLERLSKALMNQRMPQLETLNLSRNRKIHWNTFQLNEHKSLKYLSLRYNRLKNIHSLANLLNEHKLPNLKVLNLVGNPDIQLNSIHKELKNVIIL